MDITISWLDIGDFASNNNYYSKAIIAIKSKLYSNTVALDFVVKMG